MDAIREEALAEAAQAALRGTVEPAVVSTYRVRLFCAINCVILKSDQEKCSLSVCF